MDLDEPATCYCIIPNVTLSAILVRRAGGGYECPLVGLPPLRLNFFPDYIPHIRQELYHATGLKTTVLRHLQDLGDVQICVMEVQAATSRLPDDYVWLDTQGEVAWADEPSALAWLAWDAAQEEEALAVAPWERNGWFADAALWMQMRLHEDGYALTGPIEQVKGAWGWSSLLKVQTDRGVVYFKADYERPPKEAAVVRKLAECWPRNVPHLIASDMERNWMLMSDFAGVSLEPLETSHYLGAMSLFAKIQRSSVPDINHWKKLGCPDMTPGSLWELTKQLFADTAVLTGGKNGLHSEEVTELAQKLPQIEQLLMRLADAALPNVISNEDFKAGNVVLSGGEFLFYDWSSTVITHPLFGINYFLNRMVRSNGEDRFRWRNDLEDARRRGLLSVFLSEWTEYAPWEHLVAEFWLCRRLSPLYEAVRCYCDLPFIDTASPWGAGTLANVPQALRSLLASLDYQPVDVIVAGRN
jgi:hypothetical protein